MADGTRASDVPKGFNVGRAPGDLQLGPVATGRGTARNSSSKGFSYQVTRSLGDNATARPPRLGQYPLRKVLALLTGRVHGAGACSALESISASIFHRCCHHRPAGSRAGEEGGLSPPGGTSAPRSSSTKRFAQSTAASSLQRLHRAQTAPSCCHFT